MGYLHHLWPILALCKKMTKSEIPTTLSILCNKLFYIVIFPIFLAASDMGIRVRNSEGNKGNFKIFGILYLRESEKLLKLR
jgi:hypothetical protein